jgi:hypothetical protein
MAKCVGNRIRTCVNFFESKLDQFNSLEQGAGERLPLPDHGSNE